MNCPTCDLPMIWSSTHERMWCAVYGDHKPAQRGRNVVVGARPTGSVVRVDFGRREAS